MDQLTIVTWLIECLLSHQTHQILCALPYNRLMAMSPDIRIKYKAEIEIKCISDVRLVVDPNGEAENLEIIQGNANKATL